MKHAAHDDLVSEVEGGDDSGNDHEGQEHERAQAILDVVYVGLEPAEVWRHFAFLNAIPRPSGQEARARAYVSRVAREVGAESRTDGAGNIVVYKAGTFNGDMGSAPSVCIQSHLDMVCERVPERDIDWARDAILPRRATSTDGDSAALIAAQGTTLGADNGIGAAMALALLTTPGLSHPPLELLFTVQEETGLHGALALDASLLSSAFLLNLDTEEPDEIVIGCAGGRGINLSLPIERAPRDGEWLTFTLAVGGLEGGHSGIQIGEALGNAIQMLAHALRSLQGNEPDFRLVELQGGNARNAIPRDASASLVINGADINWLEQAVQTLEADLRTRWSEHEPSVSLKISRSEAAPAPLTKASSHAVVDLLCALPHGVQLWSERWPGKVETSCNLATLSTDEDALKVHISGRSFRDAEMDAWQSKVQVLAASHHAEAVVLEGYPGWEPSAEPTDPGAFSLREVGADSFARVTGSRPKIEIVHAGLECGIILSKRPGMEAISFGPLIRGAHTPEEYVDIATVEQSWRILLDLLTHLPSA